MNKRKLIEAISAMLNILDESDTDKLDEKGQNMLLGFINVLAGDWDTEEKYLRILLHKLIDTLK